MANAPSPQMAQADPLADLRDIHLPSPVEWWPPAPGWWIVAAVVAVLVIYGVYRLWRYWRANRYRREAIAQLDALLNRYNEVGDAHQYLDDFQVLLKRVALTRYPRDQVASLTGESWVDFLDKTSGSHEFSMGEGQVLVDVNYQPSPNADIQQLHQLGRLWIKRHGEVERDAA